MMTSFTHFLRNKHAYFIVLLFECCSYPVWQDIKTIVAFLTTWVLLPAEDDWAKLWCIICYLKYILYLPLTLECDGINFIISRWADAAFALDNKFNSHTGAIIPMGKSAILDISHKQEINTKSSTEAELISDNYATPRLIFSFRHRDITHILPIQLVISDEQSLGQWTTVLC